MKGCSNSNDSLKDIDLGSQLGLFKWSFQECNQEFFRAGEVAWIRAVRLFYLQYMKQRYHREKFLELFLLQRFSQSGHLDLLPPTPHQLSPWLFQRDFFITTAMFFKGTVFVIDDCLFFLFINRRSIINNCYMRKAVLTLIKIYKIIDQNLWKLYSSDLTS